jgi:hypothetical protein
MANFLVNFGEHFKNFGRTVSAVLSLIIMQPGEVAKELIVREKYITVLEEKIDELDEEMTRKNVIIQELLAQIQQANTLIQNAANMINLTSTRTPQNPKIVTIALRDNHGFLSVDQVHAPYPFLRKFTFPAGINIKQVVRDRINEEFPGFLVHSTFPITGFAQLSEFLHRFNPLNVENGTETLGPQ